MFRNVDTRVYVVVFVKMLFLMRKLHVISEFILIALARDIAGV